MSFGSDNNYLKKGNHAAVWLEVCKIFKRIRGGGDPPFPYFLDKELNEMDKAHVDKWRWWGFLQVLTAR